MDTASLIKEGGLAILAAVLGGWAWTLWMRIKELEAQILATTEKCILCNKQHSSQILEFGTTVVAAIEQNTQVTAAFNRQSEIITRLEVLNNERKTKR